MEGTITSNPEDSFAVVDPVVANMGPVVLEALEVVEAKEVVEDLEVVEATAVVDPPEDTEPVVDPEEDEEDPVVE